MRGIWRMRRCSLACARALNAAEVMRVTLDVGIERLMTRSAVVLGPATQTPWPTPRGCLSWLSLSPRPSWKRPWATWVVLRRAAPCTNVRSFLGRRAVRVAP